MIAADRPVQRPADAKLLVVDACGRITHAPRSRFVEFLRAGDLLVANDAATLPASVHGVHAPTGSAIEVRLAGRSSLADVKRFSAIVFGAGDYRTRTEDRPLPPPLTPGDRLTLGPLSAVVEQRLGHPRLVLLRFEGASTPIWKGLARHGRPIQYAHMQPPLALWDVWTRIAGPPVAFEAPSAGFLLDWAAISALRKRGIGFATITHAAGISSTGDPSLDRRLPFAEPYRIPETTARAIHRAKMDGRRVIAIGTTVVRALEHAAAGSGVVRPGEGLADQRIGPLTRMRVVDAIVSGTHEPEGSHYHVLQAFLDDSTLAAVDAQLESRGYRTHEFGDSVLIEGSSARIGVRSDAPPHDHGTCEYSWSRLGRDRRRARHPRVRGGEGLADVRGLRRAGSEVSSGRGVPQPGRHGAPRLRSRRVQVLQLSAPGARELPAFDAVSAAVGDREPVERGDGNRRALSG